MSSRERRSQRARRRADRALDAIAEQYREARLTAGISQDAVARAAGVSRERVNRFECRRIRQLSIDEIVLLGDVLGFDVALRAYPAGPPIRDVAHVALLARFRQRVGRAWRWQTEVPIPIPGDRRSIDAILGQSWIRIGVEAETRLRDAQAIEREIALKKRDARCDRMILLLAATRANREVLRAVGHELAAVFPVDTRRALAALAASRDPGGDALVLL